MRADFFEFTPAFKLVIAGNHKPGLRTVDEAIRRRFHLVPFTVTIPEDRRDPDLTEKLREEWAGILAWMIAGSLVWQQQGLRPPDAVTVATRAYLEAEDALSAWMEEATERDLTAWESTSGLFNAWSAWAKNAGEDPGKLKRFGEKLEARGLVYDRRRHGRGFRGLRLIGQLGPQPYWER
jgi:putative DNA primase/helicase